MILKKDLLKIFKERKITGGNISVDGSSSLRRSCNLSMVADSYGVIEYGKTELNMEDLLSMNKKISVEKLDL